MFETLRKASDALQGLRLSMEAIQKALHQRLDDAHRMETHDSRIAALEVGYAKWSAEAEATLLKADALFKNARNAEERARDKLKKKNGASEPQAEGEAEIRAAYADLYGIPPEDVELGAMADPPRIGRGADETNLMTARNRRLKAKYR